VLRALGQWAAPLLRTPSPDDVLQSHWLAIPAGVYLSDHRPDEPPVTLEVRTGDEPMHVTTPGDGRAVMHRGPAPSDSADAVLTAEPPVVLGLFSGRISLAQARRMGASYRGDSQVIRRITPAG
jgi:hypothetical protein